MNRNNRTGLKQQNIKYLCYRLSQQIFINKVLFVLTAILELILFFFGWNYYKNIDSGSADMLLILFLYIIFALPFILSYITLSMTKLELSRCMRYSDDEESPAGDEAEMLIIQARDIKVGELAVLILSFIFYAMSVF